ncbi:MAG TPA: hypothetical protein VGS22_11705 [Thermoanaerobaculia bacterium]|jgi:hypothetical protein|nr:hypothetical protein [Thermoanaerobaculia bacterium]
MSRYATTLSETRRNRFSLRLFAALLALALCTFVLPPAASAATCADAFANWATSGSRLSYDITSSSNFVDQIDGWDSDILKVRHNVPGIVVIGAKGAAIEGSLYVWDPIEEEEVLVGSATLADGNGDFYTTAVDVGDYCFEISNHDSSEGEYVLNINFLDGCTLGTLMPNACGGE